MVHARTNHAPAPTGIVAGIDGDGDGMGSMAERDFFGWKVVWAAFTLAICGWGLGFYGPPIYLHVLNESRGWSVGLVSLAITVHYLVGAVTVANLPAIYARWGIARSTRAGACALGLGVLGWSLAAAPWQLFMAAAISGVGWVTMGSAAVNAIVSPWFVRNRPAALALAYNGASLGGVLVAPLWVVTIGWLGFPLAAALIAACVIAAIWVLASRVFVHSPLSLGQEPDGDAPGTPAAPGPTSPLAVPLAGAAVWRDRPFLTLAAATSLGLFAQAGLLAQLYSLIVPPLGTLGAGIAMALATVAAVGGRTLLGWMMPGSAERRLFAAMSYAVQIAGCLALMAAGGQEIWLIWAGVALVGLGIGNLIYLPALIAQAEFVRADVPRVVALTVAIGQAVYAFAPAAFGLLREATAEAGSGNAPLVYAATAAGFALAIATLLAGRRR